MFAPSIWVWYTFEILKKDRGDVCKGELERGAGMVMYVCMSATSEDPVAGL